MSWHGRLDYQAALQLMELRRAELIAGERSEGELVLCEHPPVITCGRHSHTDNVLLSERELKRRGIALAKIDRGGDVSYHGPGQLMIYPVVRVGVRVHAFLQSLSEALAELAKSYGVSQARWRGDEPGLWVDDRKLAACGIHLSQGVSIHGFSLNVSTPSAAWECIVPCGLSGPGPVSLAELVAPGLSVPSIQEVAERSLPLLRDALAEYGLG